jgi:hypothetical protein
MLVDKYARQARRRPEYELQVFYGQLQHIYVIKFREFCAHGRLGVNCPSTIILASIKTCVLDDPAPQVERLGIKYYSREGAVHVIDITSVQCVVGRIRDRNRWAIIDRSGSLAQAFYVDGTGTSE